MIVMDINCWLSTFSFICCIQNPLYDIYVYMIKNTSILLKTILRLLCLLNLQFYNNFTLNTTLYSHRSVNSLDRKLCYYIKAASADILRSSECTLQQKTNLITEYSMFQEILSLKIRIP